MKPLQSIGQRYILSAILFLLVAGSWRCSLPESAQDVRSTIRIDSLWISDISDPDHDGFQSRLNVNIQTQSGGDAQHIFAELVYTQITQDTLINSGSLRSEIMSTAKSGGLDTLQLMVSPEDAGMVPGIYNFIIHIFSQTAPDFTIAQLSGDQDTTLATLKLELPRNERKVSIADVQIARAMDRDNDGRLSSLELAVNMAIEQGAGDLFLEVHGKHIPSAKDNLLLTSEPFHLDQIKEISLALDHIDPGSYDLSIIPFFTNSRIPELVYSREQNSLLANITFENEFDDPAPTDTLSFLDDSFESVYAYTHSPENPARLAVRFTLPDSIALFRIIRFRVHAQSGENYIRLDFWDEQNGVPGNAIFASDLWRYLKPGWNNFLVESDFIPAQPIYAGYHQVVNGSMSISVDKSAPFSSKNLVYSTSDGAWQNLTNSDLAFELVYEYVTSTGKTGIFTQATGFGH